MVTSLDDILGRIGPKRRSNVSRTYRKIQSFTYNNNFFKMAHMNTMNTQNNKDLFLGSTDLNEHLTNTFIMNRYALGESTIIQQLYLLCSQEEFNQSFSSKDWQIIEVSPDLSYLFQKTDLFIKVEQRTTSLKLTIYGSESQVNRMRETFTKKFEEVECYLQWMYSSHGDSVEIPIRNDKFPFDEMYPWLDGESLVDYYDRFMRSDASILVLLGPPGTGKTSMIRGLLQHTKQSAIVTYDTNILEKDYVFAEWIDSSTNIMVIEDADNFLQPRSDGNDMMHKFLNVGDGLVSTKSKKLIFSTNLPSIRDIDPALVRPGRCFDVVTFKLMTQDQAKQVAKKVNVELNEVKESWSIADIFHKQSAASVTPKSKFGFV